MTTPRDYFSSVAREYAAYRPHYPEALFDFLAEQAPARELAWDCACGNGQATLDIASRFDRVIATDSSASQIAQAPPHPRIEWRVAPAERSGIPTSTCDVVCVAQALHWLDIDAFFAEATRVSRRGALVAVWTYGDGALDHAEANAAFRHFAREVIGPYWPPERRLVDEGYRSIRIPFAEIEVPDFQMAEWWTVEQLVGYVSTWSAAIAYRKARNADPTVELEGRLRDVWGEPEQEHRIVWRLTVRAGRVP